MSVYVETGTSWKRFTLDRPERVEILAVYHTRDCGTHYKVGDNEDKWQTNAIFEISWPEYRSILLGG